MTMVLLFLILLASHFFFFFFLVVVLITRICFECSIKTYASPVNDLSL